LVHFNINTVKTLAFVFHFLKSKIPTKKPREPPELNKKMPPIKEGQKRENALEAVI
jgi:hypothetical protein